MAREIIQKIWCDPCLELNEHYEEGEPFVITLGNWKARELALCERHEKELLAPLRDILHDAGQVIPDSPTGAFPVSGPRSKEDPQLCQVCGVTLKNRSSLGSHLRQTHKMLLAVYREKYEGVSRNGVPLVKVGDDDQGALPLDGEDDTPSDLVEIKCDVPGCDTGDDGGPKTYTVQPKRATQVLGVHKAKAHGIKGPKAKPAKK